MPDSQKFSRVQTLEITDEDADRRLDNFLLSAYGRVPKSRVYRMIRSGEVRVNSRRARPSQRLLPGDLVRLPPVRPPKKQPVPDRPDWLLERIVYEDAHLIAIDKPAGLAVHGGSGVSFGAIELLRAARPQDKSLELVHRLDRDTSGCLLIARRRSCLRRLHAAFRSGEVEKRYLAVLAGKLPQERLVVDQPLLTENRKDGQRHVIVDPAGKRARTVFSVQADLGAAVLVEARIETGRTHQIRVHAQWAGAPVLGDSRYGIGASGSGPLSRVRVDRLCLHASALEFYHEPLRERLLVSAPVGDDLGRIIERLEKSRRSRHRKPTGSKRGRRPNQR